MNIRSLRKKGSLMLAVILLISISVPVSADVAAAPQYPYGLNSVVSDQAQARQMLREEWNTWKDNFISESGHRRIITDGTYTSSEGMGYGLLLAVYFNEQTLFDELYDYVMDCYNSNGLMQWKTNNGIEVDQNSNTEADQNIALALIFADKTWGSDGQVDYRTEAETLLDNIRTYECEDHGQLKIGDFDTLRKNPSYLVPGWYEVFRAYSGSDFWIGVRNQAYSLAAYAANTTTGLVPDWCNRNGGADTSYTNQDYDYGYEAIRLSLKMAVSYSWYGHTGAKSICSKQVNFFKNIGVDNIVDGYRLNGTAVGGIHSAAFVACAAAGTMTGTDRQLAKAFYDECLATEAEDYYGSTLRLFTLMYMTGNLQNIYANGKPITTSTTTTTTTTPSGAIQPGAPQGGAAAPGIGNGKNVFTISNLPIGAILEGMGGTYEWNGTEQKATIKCNGTTVEMWNGKKEIRINGVKKAVDIAPNISTNTSKILPLRSAAEKAGCVISWGSGSTKIAAVVTNDIKDTLNKGKASASKWDGVWATDFGRMELFQYGDKVVGTYGEEEYPVYGTTSGKKLICNYIEGETIKLAEFSMSADGLSFTGICGDTDTQKSDWSQWNGKRK